VYGVCEGRGSLLTRGTQRAALAIIECESTSSRLRSLVVLGSNDAQMPRCPDPDIPPDCSSD
jgi:hypothetical protein